MFNTQVKEVLGETKVEGIALVSSKPNFLATELALKKAAQTSSPSENLSSSETLPIDGLFIAIGHKPDTDLLKGKINLDQKGYIVTNERKAIDMAKQLQWVKSDSNRFKPADSAGKPIQTDFNYGYMTSVEGVFAAGDCVDYKYRQAATAIGMGVAAALEVEKYLEVLR